MYFPAALRAVDVDKIVQLKLYDMKFHSKNTLFVDCVCPDEILHDNP